jgi:hypothetical protein
MVFDEDEVLAACNEGEWRAFLAALVTGIPVPAAFAFWVKPRNSIHGVN